VASFKKYFRKILREMGFSKKAGNRVLSSISRGIGLFLCQFLAADGKHG